MKIRGWAFAFLFVWGVLAADAQSGRKVKALQSQKKEMQKDLDRSRKELKSAEKDVASKMRDIHILTNQIENRQRYIDTMEVQIRALSAEADRLQAEVDRTGRDLEKKKEDYAKALRYARVNRSAGSPLLFMLSSRTVTQMYRRSRYAREYAAYQRRLGERIVEKRNELLKRKNDLLAVKAEKDRLVAECEKQKILLQEQHEAETKNVAGGSGAGTQARRGRGAEKGRPAAQGEGRVSREKARGEFHSLGIQVDYAAGPGFEWQLRAQQGAFARTHYGQLHVGQPFRGL